MSRLDDTPLEFQALLAAACNEDATREQLQALERLATDPASMRLLADYVQLDAELRRLVRGQCNADKCLERVRSAAFRRGEPAEAGTTNDDDLLPASGFPRLGPGLLGLPPAPLPGLFGGARQATADFFQVGGMPFSYLVGSVIFATALWITSWITVSTPGEYFAGPAAPRSTGILPVEPRDADQPPPVARITGTVDCRWADPSTARMGAAVPLGGKYALASGLMEICYNTGAKVILQGPCAYEVESASGGFLSLGKLTARVETKGSGIRGQESGRCPLSTSHYPLFAVRTPTAVVTDLGTEFGVEVSREGSTISHVFRGSVKVLVAGGDGRQPRPETVLRENESARVEKGDGGGGLRLVSRLAAGVAPKFARRLGEPPKLLDLLDIVAGGDGAGHQREYGIDPSTGMQDTWYFPKDRSGDGRYRAVPWQKLIDGVFTPDGGRGRVVLDSAGHAFGGFPHTSGGAGCPIWARAAKLPPDERTQNPFEAVYAIGSGAQYMPEGRGLLGFFPNTGLTFDLAAMRELHEGVRPARFCATAGVADAHARFPQFENGQADVWVFIDGQLKLDRPGLRPEQGPVKFEVEIGPHDRFLTLVATVGVKEQGCHWLVLGDPVLKMASTGSQNTNTVGAAVPPPPQHLENKNGVAVQLPPQLENKDGVAVKLPPQHEDPGQTARKEKPMNGP